MTKIVPTEINGKKYYYVKQFASLTDKATHSIYNLIKKGNKLRKLNAVYIDGKPYIPIEELTEFPFVAPGPFAERNVYHYTEEGERV
jgi:hypothetical protein